MGHYQEIARDIRKTDAYMTSFMQRRKVEMLFDHLKRYIGLRMMRLRGLKGATEQFQLAATAQNLSKTGQVGARVSPRMSGTGNRLPLDAGKNASIADFFISISA